MERQSCYYTETMAVLCLRQGYLDRGAECYRYLLEETPDCARYVKALSDVEMRIAEKKKYGYDLKGVLSQWVRLVGRANVKGDDGSGL